MISAQLSNSAMPSQSDIHSTAKIIQLIYAGGTFGSYGKPLAALPADIFLPTLTHHIFLKITKKLEIIDNTCVKDSSQLSATDLVHFFELILSHYAKGHRQFILITGTDTLSYLGAFLAEAFAGSDICIILTASMRPLFDVDNIYDYSIDENSDAWENLTQAIGLAGHGESGVYISFGGESWPAQTVQKIHSQDLMAFTGHQRAGYPATSYEKLLSASRRKIWIEDSFTKMTDIIAQASSIMIATLYCVPNHPDFLIKQLQSLCHSSPTGIILIGFGAGNLPYSDSLARLMDKLYKQGHMLVCTTQCPFGGVSTAYAAGSWQYRHHVLSARRLTIPAIYARLLWLHLRYDTPSRRRQRWAHSMD